MKKWIGALCSALAGALSLVFLCIPALSIEMRGEKESYSGWKLLTDKTIGESEYTAVVVGCDKTTDLAILKSTSISNDVSPLTTLSKSAAEKKGVTGPIAGDADILLFHNIEAGNNTIKAMVQFGDWIFGGLVLGARAPIVLNSRSDSDMSKLYSIACACQL